MSDSQILLLVLPILIVEIALIVFALRDLLRPERRVRGDAHLDGQWRRFADEHAGELGRQPGAAGRR